MSVKEKLLQKLFQIPLPRSFTKQDLDKLMVQCNCSKGQGGRGSGIRFIHNPTQRILAFDEPHPGNELYIYQVKAVKQFLIDVGEYVEEK